LFVALALVAACRRPGRAGDTRHVTDELGRDIALAKASPERVISLAPNVTEFLFALGLGNRVVAVDLFSDEPAAALTHVPRVGSNYEPSLEAILALRPDVVLTATGANKRETADRLSALGVPVYVTDTQRLEDVFRTLRHLGELFAVPETAMSVDTKLRGELEAVRGEVAHLPPVPTLVAIWDKPLYVAGHGTFVDDLLALAGGKNVTGDASGFAVYPIESILKAAPELIVVPLHGRNEAPLASWQRWRDLPAVRANRVLGVSDALICRAGPRLGQGARALAELLHPFDMKRAAP
jgi:iron complex transport system substrate-binding protein